MRPNRRYYGWTPLRIARVIANSSNPLVDVEVIVSDPAANPFVIDMMKKYGLIGRVINRQRFMAFLLIFKADRSAFGVVEAFEKLHFVGVHNLVRNGMPGAAISGHFEWGGDTVIVELKSGMKSFAISDYGPAALEFAFRLQTEFRDRLKIVDQAYSFDLDLREFETVDQLRHAIESA